MHSTFENGHITNLRVPLLFYHPSLPRIQLAINATSLSIIPTILDLLITTTSLNTQDIEIASNLIHQYEGQSLVRPFIPQRHGRQQWNIGVLNAGGALLSVSSAAKPYRLVLPICKPGVYRFTDTEVDPNEISAIEGNSISALAKSLRRKFGDQAAGWVSEAEQIGKWWVLEQRSRWGYDGASLQDDRRPDEMKGVGKTTGKHVSVSWPSSLLSPGNHLIYLSFPFYCVPRKIPFVSAFYSPEHWPKYEGTDFLVS